MGKKRIQQAGKSIIAEPAVKYHYLDDTLMANTRPIDIRVVGAGATGSAFCRHLARIQQIMEQQQVFMNITVQDMDVVENHNIGKQAFSPAMVGINKAQALTMAINRYYGSQWDFDSSKYDGSRKSIDVVVGCVDNVTARRKMDSSFHKYYLDCGNANIYGQVVLGYRGNVKKKNSLPTIIDLYPDMKRTKDTVSCSVFESIEKQDLFINDFTAAYAATLLFDLLYRKQIDYHGYYFHLKSSLVTQIPIP